MPGSAARVISSTPLIENVMPTVTGRSFHQAPASVCANEAGSVRWSPIASTTYGRVSER